LVERFGPRFGVESAFIIAVAVVAALFELSWPLVAAAVFAAWILVAAVEVTLAGRARAEPARQEADESVLAPPLYTPSYEPEPLVGTELGAEEPETVSPVGVQAPPPIPELREVPSPPELRPAEPQLPPVASFPALRPSASRQWNLWELERRAREVAGRDPVRDEEWSFLLMYLREFADADGMLPADFDPLVRESFSDLIGRDR
jgi:hypothetical protein